jgi:hypothetical protein
MGKLVTSRCYPAFGSRRRRGLLRLGMTVLWVMPASVAAQELDRATPLLETPDEYVARPVRLGSGAVYAGADVRIEYDSNVYAANVGAIDDVRVTATPHLSYRLTSDKVDLSVSGRATIRRYFENERENAEAATVRVLAAYRPSPRDEINADLNWSRVVEERGEPESETGPGTPPRKYHQGRALLGYTRRGARFTIGARAEAFDNDALAQADGDRDYRQYSGALRIGYRVSGTLSAFGEGFLLARDFRLATDAAGVNRDSRTYGARAGFAIDPGGRLRGEAAVGVFHFKPEAPARPSRTGLSVSAGLIYTPTQRLAFTLDAFRGEVATFRLGAQGRTDTRVTLGIQQEIRHNLRWQGAFTYRRSAFFGSRQNERTLSGMVELEFLVSRNIAVALSARYAKRDSTRPSDDFDRARIGLELRLQL